MSSAKAEDTERRAAYYRGVPAMAPNAKGQSAEGEVDGLSGEAIEALHPKGGANR